MTSLTLTKQAAAHRLLLGSVRYFEQEQSDPVVVHVIASSAMSLLRELIGTRGKSYAEVTFASVFYEYAIARIENREPIAPEIPEVRSSPIVDDIERRIIEGEIHSSRDVRINIPKATERALLAHIFEPYNFLKHADRDPNDSLELSKIDPISAIAHAIAAYSFLFPNEKLDPDIRLFLEAYLKVRNGKPLE